MLASITTTTSVLVLANCLTLSSAFTPPPICRDAGRWYRGRWMSTPAATTSCTTTGTASGSTYYCCAAASTGSSDSGSDGGGATNTIDYQVHYGRGADHLTSDLQEGDVVVFQTGTWYVDGVEVGDGGPPGWEYCLVDTIQIVWSHNCEHGVVRGFALELQQEDGKTLTVKDSFDTMIDFGPEQLVARIPIQPSAMDDNETTFQSLVLLSDDLWRKGTEL